jgi:hypothetical protein
VAFGAASEGPDPVFHILSNPGISAGSVLVLAVIMVLTGRLMPRPAVKRIEKAADERVAAAEKAANDRVNDAYARISDKNQEIQTWQQAYYASEEARQLEAQHAAELLEAARFSVQVLTAGASLLHPAQALPPPPAALAFEAVQNGTVGGADALA